LSTLNGIRRPVKRLRPIFVYFRYAIRGRGGLSYCTPLDHQKAMPRREKVIGN
jgi:hypothetical protein